MNHQALGSDTHFVDLEQFLDLKSLNKHQFG